MTTVTPPFTGSYAISIQGISVKTFDMFGMSIAPKMGRNGMTTLLSSSAGTIDVSPDTRAFFDDSIRTPQPITALTGSRATVEVISDDNYKVQQLPQYRLSRQTFGIESNIDESKPFSEMNQFDPVVYLRDPNQVAYPVVIEVPNAVDPFDYSGAIEPFVIRKIIAGNSTYLGSPDNPEPTGIRGAVMSGMLQPNRKSRAIPSTNFYNIDPPRSEFIVEIGGDSSEEIFKFSAMASGSIELSTVATIGDTLFITSSDGKALAYTAAAATNLAANQFGIGVDSKESLANLATVITASQGHGSRFKLKYLSGSTAMPTGNSRMILEQSQVLPLEIADTALSSSLIFQYGNIPLTGSFSASTAWNLSGFSGGKNNVFVIDIPSESAFESPIKPYRDSLAKQDVFYDVSSTEIRQILEAAINRDDIPTGYPGRKFKSAPCGIEYENSRGIDSIAYGGLLK